MYCITPETFPVETRNTALGIFGITSNVAALIAPVIGAAILESSPNNNVLIPVLNIGCIVSAVLSFWVIETRNLDPQIFNDYGDRSINELSEVKS